MGLEEITTYSLSEGFMIRQLPVTVANGRHHSGIIAGKSFCMSAMPRRDRAGAVGILTEWANGSHYA